MKYNLLIVTDHTTHSSSNSLYELAVALNDEKRCGRVWVCSRGVKENRDFFRAVPDALIYGAPIKRGFEFDPDGLFLQKASVKISREDIDAVFIRMPQPLDKSFLTYLSTVVSSDQIINHPLGTIETSSKEFLLRVSHLCPSPRMVYTIDEAIEVSHLHEIVLKPLYSYGGKGILRLSRQHCWIGMERYDISQVSSLFTDDLFPMLSMRYLPNVSFGDKRTVVINRQILGSALRIPAKDSWICNVAQGGHAVISEVDVEELKIESELTPLLFEKGIIMYGFDTLVDDDGRRVLSEINTLSIGGLGPMAEMSHQPLLTHSARLLWDYLEGVIESTDH